jgi:hypothetical protein
MINRGTADEGKKVWCCKWCNKTYSTWNATKVLAHLTGKGSKDIAICKANIDAVHKECYISLVTKAGNKRKRNSATKDYIDRSVISHQNAGALAFENLKRGVKKNRTSSPSSTSSFLSTPTKFPPVGLAGNLFSTSKLSAPSATSSLEGGKADRMIQMTITNEGPNPAAESALTFAIADLLHSVGLTFSLSNDPKFKRVIKLAKTVSTSYVTPDRKAVGGALLELNYKTYLDRQYQQLMTDANYYGLCLYGDGATVHKMPLTNILGSGAHLTTAVLEIVDCTGHLEDGGKKSATYIAQLFMPHMEILDPDKTVVDLLYFDGASNVQKAGDIICARYPRATCLQGSEHVVSLFFSDIAQVKQIKVCTTLLKNGSISI